MANRRKKPLGTTTQPGYWAAKKAISRFGEHAIDGRSRVARLLDEARADLVASLGGPEALSAQQTMIVNIAIRTHFLLESLDAFIFSMASPVNKKKRSLYPVVKERQQLADSLARLLGQLGLVRQAKPVEDLQSYLRRKEAERGSHEAPESQGEQSHARRTHGQDDEEPAETERHNEPPEMREEGSR